MSHAKDHDPEVPRPVLIAAGLLLAFVFTTVAAVRLTTEPPAPAPVTSAAVTQTRDLQFRDNPEGGITVWDVGQNTVATVLVPGEGGFIRGVLRALARERRTNGIGADAASFRLTGYSDGRLSIEDLATGRVIDINAFGIDNARAFAVLLSAKGDLS
jgi:putative photosynthetic complex assembly protein